MDDSVVEKSQKMNDSVIEKSLKTGDSVSEAFRKDSPSLNEMKDPSESQNTSSKLPKEDDSDLGEQDDNSLLAWKALLKNLTTDYSGKEDPEEYARLVKLYPYLVNDMDELLRWDPCGLYDSDDSDKPESKRDDSENSHKSDTEESKAYPRSVLFLSVDNICRGPIAVAILTRIIKRRNLRGWAVDSAAICPFYIDEPMTEGTGKCLERKSLINDHRCRRVTNDDFMYYKYILCMDELDLKMLKYVMPRGLSGERIKLLGDYHPGYPHEIEDIRDGATEDQEYDALYEMLYESIVSFFNKELETIVLQSDDDDDDFKAASLLPGMIPAVEKSDSDDSQSDYKYIDERFLRPPSTLSGLDSDEEELIFGRLGAKKGEAMKGKKEAMKEEKEAMKGEKEAMKGEKEAMKEKKEAGKGGKGNQ